MNANVLGALTPRRRPRGRAALALLPGAFVVMLAGVSGVAAAANPTPAAAVTVTATPSPSPTPRTCHHGTRPDGTCCPRRNPCITPTPSPTPTPSATPSPTGGGSSGTGGGGPTPTPTATPAPTSTPAPTATPAPTPTPANSSGGSGGTQSGGTGSGGGSTGGKTGATHAPALVDPTPFAPLTSAVRAVTSGQGLDAARIPPVEALTPLSGLEFGNGLNLGPILLLIDVIGIGLLFYLIRTRWLAAEA
jgi:hypothetical protein